jgi:hypothetical protein
MCAFMAAAFATLLIYPLFGVASKYCIFPPADLLTLQRGHPDSDQELMSFRPFEVTRARFFYRYCKSIKHFNGQSKSLIPELFFW